MLKRFNSIIVSAWVIVRNSVTRGKTAIRVRVRRWLWNLLYQNMVDELAQIVADKVYDDKMVRDVAEHVTEHIDLQSLVDVDDVARIVASNLDLEDVANELTIDVKDVASEIDLSALAEEIQIDAEDVAKELDLDRLAEEIDVDELAKAMLRVVVAGYLKTGAHV